MDAGPHANAADIFACSNGLLHLPTRTLLPHTPTFYSVNAVEYAYDARVKEPVEWLRFLQLLWEQDTQSIATLQELFGLLLTGDTRHQKAFLLVGPIRSGKGTIARVLTALLGGDNVAGPDTERSVTELRTGAVDWQASGHHLGCTAWGPH